MNMKKGLNLFAKHHPMPNVFSPLFTFERLVVKGSHSDSEKSFGRDMISVE